MLLMFATLVYGCLNVGTTIPYLGTTHPLPWVACEKNLETLELVVLMLLMLYKVVFKTVHQHQPTNKNLSFASCLKKFSGFDFVKNILILILTNRFCELQ